MTKPTKIVFAPGCFDTFEGTQEELDSLIAEIQSAVESGTLMENSTPMDLTDLTEEELNAIEAQMNWDKRDERLN
jgi:hypothetical protein